LSLHFALEQNCVYITEIIPIDYDDNVGAYNIVSEIEYEKAFSVVSVKHELRIKLQIKNK
jgi:hypothetical protein